MKINSQTKINLSFFSETRSWNELTATALSVRGNFVEAKEYIKQLLEKFLEITKLDLNDGASVNVSEGKTWDELTANALSIRRNKAETKEYIKQLLKKFVEMSELNLNVGAAVNVSSKGNSSSSSSKPTTIYSNVHILNVGSTVNIRHYNNNN